MISFVPPFTLVLYVICFLLYSVFCVFLFCSTLIKKDPSKSYLPPDGNFRVWKKSDPATTGAYDLETIKYIVTSEEGKKYFHFFKHMLLGSEEHYFVTLLYNWDRAKTFVQSLSAQIVWNTWELGLWEQAGGFQTHTHFLTQEEWPILKGFALRGMIFARKFSSKKTSDLLNRIDSYIHFNESTDAGKSLIDRVHDYNYNSNHNISIPAIIFK